MNSLLETSSSNLRNCGRLLRGRRQRCPGRGGDWRNAPARNLASTTEGMGGSGKGTCSIYSLPDCLISKERLVSAVSVLRCAVLDAMACRAAARSSVLDFFWDTSKSSFASDPRLQRRCPGMRLALADKRHPAALHVRAQVTLLGGVARTPLVPVALPCRAVSTPWCVAGGHTAGERLAMLCLGTLRFPTARPGGTAGCASACTQWWRVHRPPEARAAVPGQGRHQALC